MAERQVTRGGSLLYDSIADWLMDVALTGESDVQAVVDGACHRLLAAGVPIARVHIAFRTLHPLFAAVAYLWRPDTGAVSSNITHESVQLGRGWEASAYYYLVVNGLPHVRRRLTGENALLDFPVLKELRDDEGGTDYLAFAFRFQPQRPGETRLRNGLMSGWMTDRKSGFTDDDINALIRVQKRIAVTAKVLINRQITDNVLHAYLGPGAGSRVLDGQIRRGDHEHIHAVIWYSDMRDSTPLAEALEPDQFFAMVNRYFECTAGAVMDTGGEVLRFIGDAVLVIFPIGNGKTATARACRKALKAAFEAEKRVDAANKDRKSEGLPLINWGLGLHVGDVLYGNIGVPERLEFSVIGSAANEAARLEGQTKLLKRCIVVSKAFADNAEGDWENLGIKRLKGVDDPMEMFSPRPPTDADKVRRRKKR